MHTAKIPKLCRVPDNDLTSSTLLRAGGLMGCSKSIVIRSLRRQGRAMPAMRRVAVDQLLRNAPAALDANGTPDGFINFGGAISWIKSFSASASNGLRSILKFEGAAIAASL
jgi:hypothetical protein